MSDCHDLTNHSPLLLRIAICVKHPHPRRISRYAPTQAEDLQITLDLEGQPAQGLLDFVTRYRVVITNTGQAPVQIWNPYELPGRNQWTLQFKSPGAKPIIVRRRDLKKEINVPTREVSEEALGKIITLLPVLRMSEPIKLSCREGSIGDLIGDLAAFDLVWS